jgi:predicted ArsR family transcriptional regulator
MKSRLLRKIAKSQKYQILAEIKRSQGLSVAELCERINLSYMGVKQHCVALEKDGYLDTWRRPKGMGRPEKAYRLTPLAQEFFPTECTQFTLEVLDCVTAVYGPVAVDKILFQIYQTSTDRIKEKINGSVSLEDKARSLAELRDADGYMSEYYFDQETRQHQIVEYNSPLLTVSDKYAIVSQLEKQMFEMVLGVKVNRELERVSGLYKSVFTLDVS